MSNWYFDKNGEYWRDIGKDCICFEGFIKDERYVFAVSCIALNDYYETPDTPDDALKNYEENSNHVETIAERYADEFEANEESPHYFIDSNDFNRLA
ncbi:hypothetical protein [Alloalcanivorax balearicus]|nr:hypothetical protein [Alloalcanivorax balearicus]